MPILAIEVISRTYNQEYQQKMQDYQDLGILYYGIYNLRPGHQGKFRQRQSLEIYKRVDGAYQLQTGEPTQPGNPVWMPEIGLGLGCEIQNHGGWQRPWLYWYTAEGERHLTYEDLCRQEQTQREAAEARIAELEARLRALGLGE